MRVLGSQENIKIHLFFFFSNNPNSFVAAIKVPSEGNM